LTRECWRNERGLRQQAAAQNLRFLKAVLVNHRNAPLTSHGRNRQRSVLSVAAAMRSIGNLPDEHQARLFGDYLLAQGIQNEVEADTDRSWLIWVADDDHLSKAREFLERFRSDPVSSEFARKAADAERVRSEEKKSQAAWRRKVRGRRSLFPGSSMFSAGPLTFALVCACAVVAALSKLGENTDAISSLFISYTMPASGGWFPEVRAGEFWRLFTPMLIHFGVAHILFNMLWLFRLGSMIESLHGQLRFALLTLAIAGFSNVAQYVYAGPGFGGMSGVDYGLFGYIWMRGKFDPSSGLYLTPQDKILMLVWFVVCFTGAVGPIANAAHAAGLIAGAAWGRVSAYLELRNPR
jgi:GlpG protein